MCMHYFLFIVQTSNWECRIEKGQSDPLMLRNVDFYVVFKHVKEIKLKSFILDNTKYS